MSGSAIAERVPAPFAYRWGAMVIDWAICLFVSYPLGSLGYLLLVRLVGLPSLWCVAPAAIFPVVYLTWGWSRGATVGMAATGLRLESVANGGRPGLKRSLPRALLVFPGGTSALALGLILYAAFHGHYPSGAEPGFGWLSIVVNLASASTYLGMVALGVARSDGRSLHDLLTGVRVTAVAPPPAPRRAVPVRQRSLSKWWLGAVPPLVWIGVTFAAITVELVLEPDLGTAVIAMAIGMGCFAGVTTIVRGVPMESIRAFVPFGMTRPLSPWWLAAVLPAAFIALIFGLAAAQSVPELEGGVAAMMAAPAAMSLLAVVVIVRRCFFGQSVLQPMG